MTPLRKRFIEDMQLRNLSPETLKNSVHHVAAFARYFGRSPEELDIEAVRQYQLYPLNDRKFSAESVNQYISSVKLLYLATLEMPRTNEYFPRVKRPSRPHTAVWFTARFTQFRGGRQRAPPRHHCAAEPGKPFISHSTLKNNFSLLSVV